MRHWIVPLAVNLGENQEQLLQSRISLNCYQVLACSYYHLQAQKWDNSENDCYYFFSPLSLSSLRANNPDKKNKEKKNPKFFR